MKKYVLVFGVLFCNAIAHAETVLLDFSSGTFSAGNTVYTEDGFTVHASNGLDARKELGTLAWYPGIDVITVSAGGGLFDLNGLTLVDRAYAGLTFNSSRGGLLTIGSISGPLTFSGSDWSSISSFTVRKTYNIDIEMEIDNVVLTKVSPVPEPLPTLMLLAGLASLWFPWRGLAKRRTRDESFRPPVF